MIYPGQALSLKTDLDGSFNPDEQFKKLWPKTLDKELRKDNGPI